MSSADTFDIMLAASGAKAPDGQPLSAFIKEIDFKGRVYVDFIGITITSVILTPPAPLSMNEQIVLCAYLFPNRGHYHVSKQVSNNRRGFIEFLLIVFRQIEQLERRLQNEQLPGEAERSFTKSPTKESRDRPELSASDVDRAAEARTQSN